MILVLFGMSGAGKTTLLKELAQLGIRTLTKDGGDRDVFLAKVIELAREPIPLVVELNTGRRSWTIRNLKANGFEVKAFHLVVTLDELVRNRAARRAGRPNLKPAKRPVDEYYARNLARTEKVARRWDAFSGDYAEVRRKLIACTSAPC